MPKRIRVPLSPVPALHARIEDASVPRHIIRCDTPGVIKKIARALWREDEQYIDFDQLDKEDYIDWVTDVLAQLHAQGYDLLSRVEKTVIDKP